MLQERERSAALATNAALNDDANAIITDEELFPTRRCLNAALRIQCGVTLQSNMEHKK